MAFQHDKFRRSAILQRLGLAMAVTGLFLWLLLERLRDLDWQALRMAVESVQGGAVLAALPATGVSFWAVGRYDLTLHRHLALGTAPRRAARAGTAAIAISQTLGLGLITGTLVRWRMLPELGMMATGRLTLAVTLGFLAGWWAVTALVLALWGRGFGQYLGLVGLAVWLGAMALACHPRAPKLWPNLQTLLACVTWAAVDLGAAGLALWQLIPDSLAWLTFFPAFLLAFGAGLLSGAPAGLGVFEVTLLALLPGMDASLLAAIMVWRMVYYALPACLAALHLLTSPPRPKGVPRRRRCPQNAQPAGADLARHGPLEWRAEGMLLGRTRHLLVGLHIAASSLPRLAALARAEARVPVLYHAPARLAAKARQKRWRVIPVAHEALIDPSRFALDVPTRATLRRKLRKAAASGLHLAEAKARKPLPQMEQVAREWALAHGGERGFSIGGWSAARVAQQRVWLAQDARGLVAFVSFSKGEEGWKLDLIRHRCPLPEGTLHALICQAIATARAEGIRQISLDHVPDGPGLARALPGPLGQRIARAMESQTAGLRQFKQSFAPEWQARYLAAPDLASLAVAGIELAWALAPRPMAAPESNVQPMHDLHAESGFALSFAAWQDKPSDCGRA